MERDSEQKKDLYSPNNSKNTEERGFLEGRKTDGAGFPVLKCF